MPLSVYCPHCAKQIVYLDQKPIFCGYCQGRIDSLGISRAATQNRTATQITHKTEQNFEAEERFEVETEEVPEIGGFELEGNLVDDRPKGMKFEDILGQKPTGMIREPGPKKINKKKVLEEFVAGAKNEYEGQRPKSITIEDGGPE